MLDSVKRYIRQHHRVEKLREWQFRHASWMTELAERVAPRIRTADARIAKDQLNASRVDMEDALGRLSEWGDRQTAMRLVAALAWHWFERGMGPEAVAVVEQTIALPGESAPASEAAALRACTFIQAVSSDPSSVFDYNRRFADAAERSGDAMMRMLAHVMSAYLAGVMRDAEAAERELAAAASLRPRVPIEASWALAEELMIRGDTLRLLGKSASALQVLGECYRLATELQHGWAQKASCYVTGKVLIEVKRPREAINVLRSGVIRSLEQEDPSGALASVNIAAAAFAALEQADTAAQLYGAVDSLGPKYNFSPQGADAVFTEQYREQARASVMPAAWERARVTGSSHGFAEIVALLAAP
jgi:hypothetical protein